MYKHMIINRRWTFNYDCKDYKSYECMSNFVSTVTDKMNELGHRFVSVHYPNNKEAIIVYKEEESIFIPWLNLDDNMAFGINGSYRWDKGTYDAIMNDEKIRELLKTNSFYIAYHPYGHEASIIDATTISISNSIGRVQNILYDGIEFIKEDYRGILDNIDNSLLRATRCCIYNRKTNKLSLAKINLGILSEEGKFILI